MSQDPLDQVFSQAAEMDAKAQQLRSSMGYAVGQNPDQQAQARAAAQQLGTTQAYANDNLKPLATAAKVNAFDYNAFINNAPRAASWLSDPSNAAVAHDDVPTLQEIEGASQGRPQGVTDAQWEVIKNDRLRVLNHNKPRNEAYSLASTAGMGFSGPILSTAETASTIPSLAAETVGSLADFLTTSQTLDTTARRIWEAIKNPLDAGTTGGDIQEGTNTLRQGWAAPVKTGPSQYLMDPTTGKPFANPDYHWYGRDTLNTVASIPGAAAFFAMTGKAGMQATVANAGQEKYQRAIEEGADPVTALAEGLGSAGINYALMNKVPHPAQANSALGQILEAGKRGVTLGTGVTAAENALGRLHGSEAPLWSGLPQGIVSMTGFEVGNTLPRLISAASTSSLKARSPEAFHDVVSGILRDSNVENVMIPADRLTTFFQEQGLDPAQEADRLGAKNYAEAITSGTDVVIPTADFLAKLKPDQMNALAQDIRVRPGGTTIREAAEHEANAPERVAQMVEQAKTELPDEQFRAFTSLKPEIQNRLEATGRFTPAIAEDNATLLARGLVTQSMREGLDPIKQFEKYGLNITGPGGEGSPMQPFTGTVPDTFKDIPGLRPSGEDFTIPTSELTADPGRFQYKGRNETTGVNQVNKETGASGALAGVNVWNPDSAGTISAWRDPADGKTYVVNGHNRYDLAKKLGVDRLKVRFIDAKNAQEAKIAGAIQNIAAGKGTAMDAASLFRDGKYTLGDLERLGIPTNKDVVTNGLALSRLSEPWYAAAKSDPEFERLAVETGKAGLTPEQQGVALQELNTVLKKKGPEDITSPFWRDMLDRIKGSQVTTTQEEGLFGSEESYQSTLEQQTDLVRFIRSKLRTDKTVGQVLTGGRYEEAVGKAATVDKEAAAGIKQDAGTTLGTFEAMKNLAGVGDVINEFATKLQQARSAKEAEAIRQQALGAVKGSIKEMQGKPKAAPAEEAQSLFQPVEKTPAQIRQEAHDLYNDPRTVEEYNALPDTKGGKLLNVDIARRLDPNYRENPTATVPHHHSEVSAFIKRIYAERMAEPIQGPNEKVVFMAGGGGSGKGSAAKAFDLYSDAHTIVDGTMKDLGSSKKMIDLALDTAHDGENARPVEINFTLRDVEKAVEGTILRGHTDPEEKGRFVGIDQLVGAHEEAPKTILTLMDDYGHDPLVHFNIVDNNGKPSDITLIPDHATRDYLVEHLNSRPDVAQSAVQAYHRVREHGYEDHSGQRFPISQEARDFLDRSLPQDSLGALDTRNQEGLGRGDGQGLEARPGDEGNQVSLNHEPGDNRGSITFGPDNKVSISILEKANASTFVHELGHFWVKMLGDLAERPEATEQTKADLQTILEARGKSSVAELTTEDQEWLARAHEAYLREGKAPSQALQGPFARFKTWLSGVYQRLTDLNVHLTDDVRGVFDRIYASDREIEQAREQLGGEQPIFESAEKAGMTDAAFEAYKATKEREIENAKGALVEKLNREAQRDRLQWWKDELAKAREEVAADIDADPAQVAFKALSEGKTVEGTPIKLNKDALVAQFGEDVLKDLPRHGARWTYAKEGGMDAQSAAEVLGFASGDQLVQTLKRMAPRNERIKADADLLMKQRHGDMLTDGSIAETALEVLHNADREKALMTELQALRKLQAQVKEGKAQARATVQEVPPIQTFKDAAQQLVEQTTVRDLEPYRYLVASRQASREAFKAMAGDDYATAGDAKQKELLNHFLYLESTKAKTEAGDIAAYGKDGQAGKFQAMLGKAGSDYRDQWNALAGRYEFSQVTNKELDNRKSLAEWAADQSAAGEEVAIDPSLYREGQAKNWREVPLSELRAVKDALKNIETIARRANKVTAEGKAIDFDVAVENLTNTATLNMKSKAVPLSGSTLTAGERLAAKARSANAALLPMEQLMDRLDGGDVTGPWHEHFMNRASEAQNKEHELAARLAIPIKEALAAIPTEIKHSMLDFTGIRLPGMDRDLNRKQLLSIALNRGNEQNWEKLLHGRGWTSMESQAEIGRGLAKLTAPEWEFAQKVWDAFESLRPEIGDLQRKMTGLEPQWVEARPFAAVDEKGNVIAHLKGGYYPLVADPGESGVGMRQDIDAGKGVMDSGSGYVRATTSTGYTKERTKATYPLLLDFEQIVTQHATKIAKDLAYREFVVDSNRLLTDQRVRDTLRETLGPEYEKQFMPWLRYQANNRNGSAVQGLGEVSRWMMQLRANAVVATMGFNLATTVVQFSGITRAQHYVEGGHLLRALGEFIAHPMDTTKMVRELSGEMANRAENYDRDMGGVMRGELTDSLAASANKTVRSLVLPVMKANSEVMKFAFHGITLADIAMGVPTWLGAYRQGLATHGDAARAVLEGDRAVRMTLPAAGAKDLAPIMRNHEFWKMATMYYGHFNKLYANMEDSAHKASVMAGNGNFLGATKQAASTTLLTLLIPAVFGAYIKNRGPADDENKAEWAILESLHFGASSIPLIRNIADTLKNGKSGKDFKFSPMFGIFEEQTQALMSLDKAAHGDAEWSKAGFDAAKAFGHTFGIGGTTQAVKSAHYLQQVSSGQERPANNYELVKNTLLGKNPAEGGHR